MKLHGEQQCFKLKVRKWKICKYFPKTQLRIFNPQSQVKLSFEKLQIGKLFGNLAINDRDKYNLNDRDKYNLNDKDKYNLNDRDKYNLTDRDKYNLNDRDKYNLNDGGKYNLNDRDKYN